MTSSINDIKKIISEYQRNKLFFEKNHKTYVLSKSPIIIKEIFKRAININTDEDDTNIEYIKITRFWYLRNNRLYMEEFTNAEDVLDIAV